MQSESSIRAAASELDEALEAGDIDRIVACFAVDCTVELLGVRLHGHDGVRRWLDRCSGSALIGAGNPAWGAVDFNGAPHPATGVDAGAYQRIQESNPGWQPQSAFKTLLDYPMFADSFESL